MPTKRARQDTTLQPLTPKNAPEELDVIQRVAAGAGVSVSYLLRAAGTPVAANPEWLAASFANQVRRYSRAGGNILP
jgi:hypothetical protein